VSESSCATLSVAGAISMILKMDHPFEGLIRELDKLGK